jgi:hypothetical protein
VPNALKSVARYSDSPKRTNAVLRPFPARHCGALPSACCVIPYHLSLGGAVR